MNIKQVVPFISLFFLSAYILGQSFDIGHSSLVFYDSLRSRNIETEIYYPADTAGEDVALAAGNFPVLVFGHGFLMSWEAYENFWTALVPEGYVMCFPTTEMGFSPSHAAFGLDLAAVVRQMQRANADSSSRFFQALAPQSALMGHSMGGGASILAAADDPTLAALVNFAAAETNPSAISAAARVSAPSLIFSGDDDCVSPSPTNQEPIYDSLASACKTHIHIIDGGHCYFADENFTCSLGESFCNPTLNISREAQHATTFDFLKLWLSHSLYNQPQARSLFNDSLQASSRIQFSQSCQSTGIDDFRDPTAIRLFPNPVSEQLHLRLPEACGSGLLKIYSPLGEEVLQQLIPGPEGRVDVSGLVDGGYFWVFAGENMFHGSGRFLKMGK